MLCPFCGKDKDKVIDSRSSDEGRVIRRRRECLVCTRRFTTYERAEDTARLMVIKKDDSRMPYDRARLMGGIEKACYKRPVAAEQILAMVEAIEDELFRTYEREVDSSEIGNLVSEHLKRLDQVAYVRYASVYKQFRDIEDFLHEVKHVMESTPPPDGPNQGRLF